MERPAGGLHKTTHITKGNPSDRRCTYQFAFPQSTYNVLPGPSSARSSAHSANTFCPSSAQGYSSSPPSDFTTDYRLHTVCQSARPFAASQSLCIVASVSFNDPNDSFNGLNDGCSNTGIDPSWTVPLQRPAYHATTI